MKTNHRLNNNFWQLLTGLMWVSTTIVHAQTNSSALPPAGSASPLPVISAAVATNPPPSFFSASIEVQAGDTFYSLARCKRRLKSAAGGARKVLHPPGKEDWI